jgi:hypothetical protein
MAAQRRNSDRAKADPWIVAVDFLDQGSDRSMSCVSIDELFDGSDYSLAVYTPSLTGFVGPTEKPYVGTPLSFLHIKLQRCILILRNRSSGAGKMITQVDRQWYLPCGDRDA